VNLSKLNKKLKDNLTSEIAILKGLHHPHIVALIDCKESTAHIHLVMEYCALGDLSYFIKKRDTVGNNPMTRDMMQKYPNPRAGGLNEVVVRHFLQQLSSSLSFLRSQNLIHRDVKPQNLLLNPSPLYYEKEKPDMMPFAVDDDSLLPICGIRSLPMLKIADFGFARSLPSTSLAETLCGSPLYMAPEILRYEKYDAKADLWSVGTVLYEMVTGKPPFRASNHVELLRRIEKGEDRIKFPDEVLVSDALKKLIRSLLKRDPKERSSFPDFFSNEVIIDPIPGLVGEDRPLEKVSASPGRDMDRRQASLTDPVAIVRRGSKGREQAPYSESQNASQEKFQSPLSRTPSRQATAPPSRPNVVRRSTEQETSETMPVAESLTSPPQAQRPPLSSHTTAPAMQELRQRNVTAATAVERGPTRGSPLANPSLIRAQVEENEKTRAVRSQEEKERERAAQDIAFERDYVMVEKRAVEMNAFADELAASPKIQRGARQHLSPQSGAIVRRATTQGAPISTSGAQTASSKAVQIGSGKARPDVLHHRQSSFERHYGRSPNSASSAISKALNMASGRLFGVGFSPPLTLGRGGRSPPSGYNPFPAYPATQGSLVIVGDGQKITLDEDTKFVQTIEECATRSDVVYGFAEVKYQQLIPSAPSAKTGLGLRQTIIVSGNAEEHDVGGPIVLDVEARVNVSEEALILYVKALSLLAKSMDIAGRWWARKNRGEVLGDTAFQPSKVTSLTNPSTGIRVNNVVQWIRTRFNEVLEKAEVVRLTLIDSQKKLPPDHPSHPDNHSTEAVSSGSMGTSVDHVVVSCGVTAEKIMYDRAVEMSRASAINELTGEDLPACEINYTTAIRLLEAVLEDDEDYLSRKSSSTSEKGRKSSNDDDAPINGLEAEDRKTVRNCKFEHISMFHARMVTDGCIVVASIRARLVALRKKLQGIQKRAPTPMSGGMPRSSAIPHRPSPPIASTPPKS
jgi:serine/threonine-protein kinase ULK2